MPKILPTTVFPNAELVSAGDAVSNESFCIPLSSLVGLSPDEANPTTGNGAEVARLIVEAIHSNINALATDAQPTGFGVIKTQNLNGQPLGQIRNTYTINADITYSSTTSNLVEAV